MLAETVLKMAFALFALALIMITTSSATAENVKQAINGSQIIEELIAQTRFPITMGVLTSQIFFAVISGPTISDKPMEIDGSLIFRQPLSSMKAGDPVLGNGGQLLQEVYPELVDRFKGRLSNLGVMCTSLGIAGNCFFFMASKDKKNKKKKVMLTYDLNVNSSKICSLPLKGWAETMGDKQFLFPLDRTLSFFSYYGPDSSKDFGKLVYSFHELALTSRGCPIIISQKLTSRYLCSPYSDSSGGFISRKPCTIESPILGFVAGFVYGDQMYHFAGGQLISMPLEMFDYEEKTFEWKHLNITDFWTHWKPSKPNPDPLPSTDFPLTTFVTEAEKTTSKKSSPSLDTTENGFSSSTTSSNSHLLLLIMLILVIVCAITGGIILFWFCCSSKRRTKEKGLKQEGKKEVSKKVEVRSKVDPKNKKSSLSKAGSNSQLAKTTSFLSQPSSIKPLSKVNGQSGSQCKSSVSVASKVPLSKVTVRSKQTTVPAAAEKVLPADLSSNPETSILTNASGKSKVRNVPPARSKQPSMKKGP